MLDRIIVPFLPSLLSTEYEDRRIPIKPTDYCNVIVAYRATVPSSMPTFFRKVGIKNVKAR